MALLIDASLQQLEQLLEDFVSIGMKRRKATVADVATLRAQVSHNADGSPLWFTGDLVYVTGKTNVYKWAQASLLADDGDLVLRPDDTAAGATGRWLKVVTALLIENVNAAAIAQPAVAVANVVLHNGDFSEDVLKQRIYGKSPCVAIHFNGGAHKPLSQVPGALYDYRAKFEIWSVSRNYRDRFEAALGSEVPSSIDDVGVMVIHGTVKKLLAGKSGQDGEAQLGEPSIKYIEIGDEELVESNLAERTFVMGLQTEVLASIHNPDAAAARNVVTGINVQRKEANAPAPLGFDLRNCVTAGLTVPQANGYTVQVAGGAAVIGGTPITMVDVPHTFGADVDTWRELTPQATWIFHQVPHGSDAPAPAVGNLMVGVTVTDAGGIVVDRITASMDVDYPAANTPDVLPVA